MPADSAFVLVTGATGRQGGATARALLAAGVPVRALVRDPASARARAVEALGAELVTGDLHDRDSVVRAAEGARTVFSVQMPGMTEDGFDFEGEITQGVNLVEGAKAAGMPPVGAAHEWLNVVGQPARPQYARDLGLPLTGFEEWVRENLRATA
ncbi:NmrA family NAD(P)-binding protein [Streptomyces sp. TRM 70361]|nr:NmrA family NAD(P)-binding protein [Streptomyces sp. TRM 70361]MEE1938312.1 NmrA family NAD(P)-binding protein [Streptomyces sp. TRM 70361]